MTPALRVGTRGSPLARIQTQMVVDLLRRAAPRLRVTVLPIVTAGDRRTRSPPVGDFTEAIDHALLAGEVDLAVHSAKDLPTASHPDLVTAAVPRRGDPTDALVLRRVRTLAELPRGACLGSSSVRRHAQLKALRPDLEIIEIRGNVGTRLQLMESRQLDGLVLASAGLQRLGLSDRISQKLSPREVLPSPGQGALAVRTRAHDAPTLALAQAIDHRASHAALMAEQAFARGLGGDCDLPLGALARARGALLQLNGEILSANGRKRLRAHASGSVKDPEGPGLHLAQALIHRGAHSIHPGFPR